MGTAEEDARNSLVNSIMNGSQQDRDRFIITTLINISENGCAKACSTNGASSTRVSVISTGVAAAIIGVVEAVKALMATK
jgi:hypothetical protein